jgi:spermidine synthase
MNRYLPWALPLFVASGCAALIYEVVWFQLLELYTGSTALSLGVLLGSFMGGMCAGSLGLPRWVSPRRHPLRVYAAIEAGIAALAIAVYYAAPWAGRLYAAAVGYGLPGSLLRGAYGALCLLPPAILMGATLPAVARWVQTTPRGVSWLGFFYGGNTVGAVAGCLLAGFYLLRIHGAWTATLVAAALNVSAAAAAWLLSARVEYKPNRAAPVDRGEPAAVAWPIYVAIGISGCAALGAEVVWTRLLSLMLGATVYTFSLILAVFLLGLALGSSVGALAARVLQKPRTAFGVCQWLVAAAAGWAAYALTYTIPYLPVSLTLNPNPWHVFQLDLMRCLWVALPAACLWGASFPLALASAARPGQDPGRLTGRIYAANTLGAIAGALAFSLVLIPWAGTRNSQRLLMLLGCAAGLLLLARPLKAAKSAALAAALAVVALLAFRLEPIPWEVIGYGRKMLNMRGFAGPAFVGEGRNASVAVSRMADGTPQFHISGRVEASADLQDLRMERMLGHLPALLHSGPESVLVVGCGAGITAGTFVLHPRVNRIVICELEPLVPKVVARYFGKQNYGVLEDPRTQVVMDDARHYVFTTREKFDLITSDPIHPWIKGAATLYTREYFQMCKRLLKPGGVVAQWVPLYESTLDTVRSELATFFEVFPDGTIWSNHMGGPGYDVVLIGTTGPLAIDLDALEARLARAEYARVAQSLREVRFGSALELISTYAGHASDLRDWLRGAAINDDRNLRLQYLAGMGLNYQAAEYILDELLARRRYPDNVFRASPQTLEALRKALGI